jgi:hypothetical protein
MLLATETRVLTMGDANMIVKDVANISLFPQTIINYPNLFIAENDDDDYFWSVGAHLKLDESSTPAVIGAYFSTYGYYNWLYYNYGHGDYISSANNRIALVYGREMGGNPFGVGFRYYRASEKGTYEEDTANGVWDYLDNYEYSLTRYELTTGISLKEKKLELSAGIGITTWNDKEYYYNPDPVYGDFTKPKGNLDLMLNARYWMNPRGKYVLIPHFSFWMGKEGLDYHPGRIDSVYDGETYTVYKTNTVFEDKYTQFDLGIGMNYEAAENILIVGDVGIMLEVEKEKMEYEFPDYVDEAYVVTDTTFETKWTWNSMPYFRLGIDAEVFKWLNLRAGAETWWVSRKYEPARNDYEYSNYGLIKYEEGNVQTNTYLGAGCHWNNLGLDARIDPQFLTNGPYFISGDTDYGYGDFAWQVSLFYKF